MKKNLSFTFSLILIIFFNLTMLFGFCSLIKKNEIGSSPNDNTIGSIEEPVTDTAIDWSRVIISCLGDSITQGGYPSLLQKQLDNAPCLNYGIGGSTCASRPSSTNDTGMVLRYNKISQESDIIIVMCGINDGMANIPFGTIESTDTTTYYGALNTLCSGLKESYPNAWVFFMTNFHYANSEELNGVGVAYKEYYSTAVKNVCEKYDIDVFDTFSSLEFDTSANTRDNVHLTSEYQSNVFVPAIAQFIRTNYKEK